MKYDWSKNRDREKLRKEQFRQQVRHEDEIKYIDRKIMSVLWVVALSMVTTILVYNCLAH